VLGFFEEEAGEVHLFFQATFGGDCLDEREQVQGNGFLTSLEQAGEVQDDGTLKFIEAAPILDILAEVDIGWIPYPVALCFFV
jgi:hypothetical protein